jgi:hypothetical protein
MIMLSNKVSNWKADNNPIFGQNGLTEKRKEADKRLITKQRSI